MARLELYLKGKRVIDIDVFLPEYPKDMPFETRCDLRTAYLDEHVAGMFSAYIIPIMKAGYDYQIVFVTQSHEATQPV